MDLVGKLVQTGTCAADGSVAARNPLSNLVSSVVENGGTKMAGVQDRASMEMFQYHQQLQVELQHGLAMNAKTMDPQQNFVPFHQEHIRGGAEDPHVREFMKQYQSGHHTGLSDQWAKDFASHPHGNAFERAFNESQHAGWVDEFQRRHHHAPPDPRFQELDAAWEQSHFEAAWQHSLRPLEEKAAMPAMYTNSHETQRATAEMIDALSSNTDPRWQNSEFLKFMNDVNQGKIAIDHCSANDSVGNVMESAWNCGSAGTHDDLSVSWAASAVKNPLESVWNESESKLEAAWDEQNHTGMSEVELENIWQRALNDNDGIFEDAWGQNEVGQETELRAYDFLEDNPYLSHSDPFEEGIRLFKAGEIKEAILAFEAEVKQRPENSEGWRLLGECHAENDEDKKAIICLERSVEQDPYNLAALLALGVSYVNELDPQRALTNLKSWVEHNPKFQGLQVELDGYSDGTLMDEVMQLMLQADAFDPTDADVKVVLGVLYNVSRDYDAAVGAFRSGVDAAPDNYSLWNKLGATLANSSRSEEALPAYHRALELKPKYARGWLNLGISHANLGNYREAARSYLHALSLNSQATHIWSYLRIAFTCIDRFDLVKLTDTQDINAFAEEFELIQFQ